MGNATEFISPSTRGGERMEERTTKEKRTEVVRGIERLLEQLENAINPDFRVAKARQIKMALDDLEREVGSRAVEKYYQRLNRAFGETLEDLSLLEIDKERLPKEVVAEGKRRVLALTTAEKMLDQLETESDSLARESLAQKIEEFLDQNEKVIAKSDNSGAKDVRDLRQRLDGLKIKKAAA